MQRGSFGGSCELFSFANIQATNFAKTLSSIDAQKGKGNVGPTIFCTDIGQERGRRVMSSSGTSHVTELSVSGVSGPGEPQFVSFENSVSPPRHPLAQRATVQVGGG